ncbi:MAG: hypothetical protein WCI64_03740 [Chlorobium sp.]
MTVQILAKFLSDIRESCLRQIKTIIEFKQIIGRGARLFDGKEREIQHTIATSFAFQKHLYRQRAA